MYYSSRNNKLRIPSSIALLNGLSDDGGLYLIDQIPELKLNEDDLNLSYQDLAKKILSMYFDDFTKEEIEYCVTNAYSKKNFHDKVVDVKSFDNYSFLELFHGNTLAFKDMALSILPYLLKVAMKKQNVNALQILTATSGDTGSAALNSFYGVDNISIKVLYPYKGISKIQEKQMLYFTSSNSRAYSLKNGNFDDCQRLVKKCLNEKNGNVKLSSANSINIGRLIPQIVYYYYSYILLVKNKTIKLNDEIDVIVPTGNFGNIFACYLAKQMGLPVNKLVCSSNCNDVLDEFFKTGKYDADRNFYVTNSPSMDILVSSNLERLLSLISNEENLVSYMTSLKENKCFEISKEEKERLKTFTSYSSNEEETLNAMRKSFEENNYLIDPHTAVAYDSYLKYKNETKNHVLIASTASFYKFPKTVATALRLDETDEIKLLDVIKELTKVEIPHALDEVIKCNTPKEVITDKQFIDRLFKKKNVLASVPGTSANLSAGFDICGLALDIFNKYKFELNDKDELVNFDDRYNNENNLVLKSYKYLLNKSKLKYLPIKISQEQVEVPTSRGLGSSSTCIVAGLLGANALLNNKFSKEELLTFASEIEGHPDNVAPALFGGFVTSFKEEDKYYSYKYPVSDDLIFVLAVPEFELLTSKAREVLPKEIKISDFVYDASRLINLPKALKDGDIKLLKKLLSDKIHEPYRLPLIPDADKFKELADKKGYPFAISGAGSTLLMIIKEEVDFTNIASVDRETNYNFYLLKALKNGATIKEMYYEE